MKVIREYLDSLFLSVPMTPETTKAKEDLLVLMEDHYQALIAEGKTEAEAIGTVISEFGSIDELLDELNVEEKEPADFLDGITMDETIEYWQYVRLFALETGLGVAAFCWSVSMMVLYPLIRTFSILGFFILVAIGLGLVISGSLKYATRNKTLDHRPFYSEVITEAKQAAKDYEKSFRMGLVLGILTIVMAVPAGVAITMLTNATLVAGAITFGLIGLGVFLIIYTSIVFQHYVKVSRGPVAEFSNKFEFDEIDNNLYATNRTNRASNSSTYVEKEDLESRYPVGSFVLNIYWFAVLMIYLTWSRLFGGWGYTWIIFIIGGVFHKHVYAYIINKLKK